MVLDLIRSFAVLRHEQRPYAVDPETGTVVMDATEQDFRDAVAAFGAFMASCGSQVQKLTPAESRCVNAILAWGATEFTRARLIDAVGLSQQRVHQILHGRKDRGGGGLLGKCPGLNVVSMTIHGDERSIMQNSYRVDQEALRAWMGMPTIYLAPGDDGEDRSTRSTPDQPPINHDVLIGQNTTSEGESTINRSNGGIICTCTDRSTIGETQADQHTSPSPHTPGDLSHGVRDRVCDDEVVDRTRWDDLAKPTSATETGRAPTRTARSRSTEMVDRGLIGGRSGVDRGLREGLIHPLPGVIDPAEFSRAGSDHVDCAVCGHGCASRGGAFRSRDGLTTICGHCLDRELARESRRAGVA